MTLFGDYKVIYVCHPGLPSSPPSVSDGSMGFGPSGGSSVPGIHERPFMANVIKKAQKMNAWAVAGVSVPSFVLFLMCIGLLYILLKLKKLARRSSTVGPAVTQPITKRSDFSSFFSSSTATSRPVSLTSTIATCKLSIKTFTLTELEKATDCFTSDKILGDGGFGHVYHGAMEDGSEAAIKLLTGEDQSGDHEFIVEVEMLSQLHHRNLVELIGICIEDHTRCLVYEVVSNGSVETHLLALSREKALLVGMFG